MTQLNSRKPAGGDVVLESRHLIGLFAVMVVIFGVVFVLGYELGRNQYTQQVHAASTAADDMSAAAQPAPELSAPAISKSSPANPSAKQSSASASGERSDSESQPATNWDYYKAVDNATPAPHLEKPVKNPAPAPVASLKSSRTNSTAANSSTAVPSGAIAPIKPAATPSRAVATKNSPSIPSKPQSLDAPLMPHGSILLQVAALTRQSDALAMAQVLQKKKFPTIVLPPSTDNFYRVQVGPYHNLESAISARNALENAGFKSIIKR
jgi:cell division septation protein DedD